MRAHSASGRASMVACTMAILAQYVGHPHGRVQELPVLVELDPVEAAVVELILEEPQHELVARVAAGSGCDPDTNTTRSGAFQRSSAATPRACRLASHTARRRRPATAYDTSWLS